MIDLVVFDWDGTLMDSQSRIVHAMTRAFEAHAHERPAVEAIRDIIGLDLVEGIRRIDPALTDAGAADVANSYRHEFRAAVAVPSPLFEDVECTLRALAADGVTLAVATGKSRAGLDRAMRESGVERWFTTSRCGEECAPKPHPGMLLEILRETGASAARTVMVGDTEFDLRMAQAACVHGAAVTYGAHQKSRLLDLQPAIVLDAIRDLPASLARLQVRHASDGEAGQAQESHDGMG